MLSRREEPRPPRRDRICATAEIKGKKGRPEKGGFFCVERTAREKKGRPKGAGFFVGCATSKPGEKADNKRPGLKGAGLFPAGFRRAYKPPRINQTSALICAD
jgi:hypothetical protein